MKRVILIISIVLLILVSIFVNLYNASVSNIEISQEERGNVITTKLKYGIFVREEFVDTCNLINREWYKVRHREKANDVINTDFKTIKEGKLFNGF